MVRLISALPLALLASVAIAAIPLPLERRQSSTSDMSTEEYNCHLNCGMSNFPYLDVSTDCNGIGELYLDSESDSTDYCSTGNYTTELSACLACADTYDIWQYYGSGVSSAASACGDTSITPSAAASTTAATASAAATGNSTVTSGSAASTTGAASGASSPAVSVTTTSTPGSTSTTGSSSSASASASVEASTGGASSVVGEISFAAVLIGFAARLIL